MFCLLILESNTDAEIVEVLNGLPDSRIKYSHWEKINGDYNGTVIKKIFMNNCK